MKCWHYDEINEDNQDTCINCHHWGVTRCKDEVLLREHYEESKTFDAFDHMMRDNKGVKLDA